LYENGFPIRNQDLPRIFTYAPVALPDRVYDARMSERNSSREVHVEERGPHWVAWIRDAAGKPLGSVVLVGRSRKEAEERAQRWGDLQAAG
jgi:hypothetical protein